MHLQGLPLLTDTLLGKYGECFAASYCKGKPVLVHFVAGMAGCTKEFQTLSYVEESGRRGAVVDLVLTNSEGECAAQGQPWLQGSWDGGVQVP